MTLPILDADATGQPADSHGRSFVDAGGLIVCARDTELHLWERLSDIPASSAHRITLFKPRRMIDALVAVLDRVRPKRMIEVGIYHGGSTIYWAERYAIERLVAFDLDQAPMLTSYVERHGLSDSIRPHFGVSQNDSAALRDQVRSEFMDHPVDAVIDDASHQYHETRTTVEALLPFVRPGGAYIIEDWAWGHAQNWPPDLWATQPLMSPLLTELMLICGKRAGVIDRLEIDPSFAVVWRGAEALPIDGSFRLKDHYVSRNFTVAL